MANCHCRRCNWKSACEKAANVRRARTSRVCQLKIGLSGATTAPATAAPVASSSVSARRVRLSHVLSQVDDTEVDILSESQLLVMYARYETLFGQGQRPHPSREPSIEQITAVHGLLQADQNPYVDLAIFGPFATRMKKRLKFQGLTLSRKASLCIQSCMVLPTLPPGRLPLKYMPAP